MPIDPNYQPRNFHTVKPLTAGDIILGTVISTAKIQLADRVRIVVVFNTSTYYMFFHEFEAKNMRTPRSKWIWTKQYSSIYGDASRGGTGGFYTLESYAEKTRRRYQGTRITIKRYVKSKDLRAMIEHTTNPPKAQPRPGDTFFVASKITSGKKITKFDRAQMTASVRKIFNSQIGE